MACASLPIGRLAVTDEYRARLVKFIQMHGSSELMGVLPEREWILRAPTLQRKLARLAEILDDAVDQLRVKKICWEESFHILHGRDVVLAMVNGTDQQFGLVQEALDRWWEPLMHFHGNPIPPEDDPMYVWRIKSQANEDARQQFLDGYVPQIR